MLFIFGKDNKLFPIRDHPINTQLLPSAQINRTTVLSFLLKVGLGLQFFKCSTPMLLSYNLTLCQIATRSYIIFTGNVLIAIFVNDKGQDYESRPFATIINALNL